MLQSCPAERRVHVYCHLGEARTFINRGAICPFTSGCTLLAFEAINLSDNCPRKTWNVKILKFKISRKNITKILKFKTTRKNVTKIFALVSYIFDDVVARFTWKKYGKIPSHLNITDWRIILKP